MDDWKQWVNLIVALIIAAPFSIFAAQALKRAIWPDGVKAALAVGVCLLVGVAQTWIAGSLLGLIGSWGSLSSAEVLAWAGAVLVAAQIEYHAYFARLPWMKKLASWWVLPKTA